MLTEKEVGQLSAYLKQAQNTVSAMNNFAGTLQDEHSRQLLQQIAQKNAQNAKNMSQHLNAGQSMQ